MDEPIKILYVYPVHHTIHPGDEVYDLTALEFGWPDNHGKVIEVDGTNVKVEYDSGNTRWKMYINLRKV